VGEQRAYLNECVQVVDEVQRTAKKVVGSARLEAEAPNAS